MKLLMSFLLAVSLFAGAVQASEFTTGPVSLPIPAGFEGPVRQSMGGATVVGFGKPGARPDTNTLLQVTIYDFGMALAGLPDAERGAAATRHLADFISGVERRRTGFSRTATESLLLDGVPAARATWTGRFGEIDTVGVMYCVVVGTQVISFHTQDAGTTPTPGMLAAIRAFDAARFSDAAPGAASR
jgi:hypothetical protein